MKTLVILLLSISFNSFASVNCDDLLQELRDIDSETRSLSDRISELESLVDVENDPEVYDRLKGELGDKMHRKLYLHALFDQRDRKYGRACKN